MQAVREESRAYAGYFEARNGVQQRMIDWLREDKGRRPEFYNRNGIPLDTEGIEDLERCVRTPGFIDFASASGRTFADVFGMLRDLNLHIAAIGRQHEDILSAPVAGPDRPIEEG